jgi:hypothetical protein
MASRQTRIESMPPNERQEQERWAQSQLKQLSGTCPLGFEWGRIPGGYRCQPYGPPPNGLHKVTDELLAEGKGGVYCQNFDSSWFEDDFRGPFYPNGSHGELAMRGPSGELITYP